MSTSATRSLRIALLNSADYGGGAENVARTLRDGLEHRGHTATLWVGRNRRGLSSSGTRALPVTESQRQSAMRFARKGFFNLGLRHSESFCASAALEGVDVVHLHNLHGHYFSITAVPELARRAPLVWTFHDFFPITGGCAFPYDCSRWRSQCGDCPQRGRYPLVTQHDRTRRMQSIKRRVFHWLPVTIVTPSRHLARAVEHSGMFNRADFRVIPNAVDTELFFPHRADARKNLGLPPASPVVLLVAQGLDDPRKGVDDAVRALRGINGPDVVVLLVGAGETPQLLEALRPRDVRSFGYVSEQQVLARCYAAADLLLFTSRAENFPCVVQEAMACGTPVLAFDIDGVNEQIEQDKNGFLVPAGDVDALTHALHNILRNKARTRCAGAAARDYAERHWGLDLFLHRHERLYGEARARAKCLHAQKRPVDAGTAAESRPTVPAAGTQRVYPA